MNYADLPPAMKARVDAQLAKDGAAPARARKRSSRRQLPEAAATGRCQCGEPMTPTAWERHHDALGLGHRTGHRRYICDVGSGA